MPVIRIYLRAYAGDFRLFRHHDIPALLVDVIDRQPHRGIVLQILDTSAFSEKRAEEEFAVIPVGRGKEAQIQRQDSEQSPDTDPE